MKVVILAGGVGSRLSEETISKPKPMVDIGGKPILWHIMKYYASFGFRDFVIALGYRGDYIKRWFIDYAELQADVKVDLSRGNVVTAGTREEDWVVELVDTGATTATGGRIKRLAQVLEGERFLLTWGDGVSTVDIRGLLEFHESHGRACTLTAVRPPARFGHLELDGDQIIEFSEKPQTGGGWINGAFFVCEPRVHEYIGGDTDMFERAPLEGLARDGELMAYRHGDFWQCMDTLRDKKLLDELWESGKAPWKVWAG